MIDKIRKAFPTAVTTIATEASVAFVGSSAPPSIVQIGDKGLVGLRGPALVARQAVVSRVRMQRPQDADECRCGDEETITASNEPLDSGHERNLTSSASLTGRTPLASPNQSYRGIVRSITQRSALPTIARNLTSSVQPARTHFRSPFQGNQTAAEDPPELQMHFMEERPRRLQEDGSYSRPEEEPPPHEHGPAPQPCPPAILGPNAAPDPRNLGNRENHVQVPIHLWPGGIVHYYYVRDGDNMGLPVWDGSFHNLDNRPLIDALFQRWSNLLFGRVVFRRLHAPDDRFAVLRVSAMSRPPPAPPGQYATGGTAGDATTGTEWPGFAWPRLRLTVMDQNGLFAPVSVRVAMHEIAHLIGCSHGLARSDRDRCVRFRDAAGVHLVTDQLFQRNFSAPSMDHDPPIEEYDYYSCVGGQTVTIGVQDFDSVDLWGNVIRRARFPEIASPGDISKILQWYQMEAHPTWGFFRSLATFPPDPTAPRTSELPLPAQFAAGGVNGGPRRTFPIGSPAVVLKDDDGGRARALIVSRGLVPVGAPENFPDLWQRQNQTWEPVSVLRRDGPRMFVSGVASDPSLSNSGACIFFDRAGVLRGVELELGLSFVVQNGQVPGGPLPDGGGFSSPVAISTANGLMVLALSADGMAYFTIRRQAWSEWTEMSLHEATAFTPRIGGCVRIDPEMVRRHVFNGRKVLLALRVDDRVLRLKEIIAAPRDQRENSPWGLIPRSPRPLAFVAPSITHHPDGGYRVVIPDTEGHLWSYTPWHDWEPIGGRALLGTAVGLASSRERGCIAMRGVDWMAANWDPRLTHGAVWLRDFSFVPCQR